MTDGETAREDSPDPLHEFVPFQGQKSDDSPLSQYSSCGESEFDRYCSANSVMGTPSMCSSSFGTFNECIDSELGFMWSSGLGEDGSLENFSLGGGFDSNCENHGRIAFLGGSDICRNDHGIENREAQSDGERTIKNGSKLRDGEEGSSSQMASLRVESGCGDKGSLLSGLGNECHKENANAKFVEDAMFNDGIAEEDSSSHVVNEVDRYFYGLNLQSNFQFEEREDGNCCEEDGTSSRYEHSEDEDSMYKYGTDDELKTDLNRGKNVQYRQEEKAENGNPLLMNSSLAFGSEDWDDFVQETGESAFPSLMLDKFQEQKEQNLKAEKMLPNSSYVTPIGLQSISETTEGENVLDVPIAIKQVHNLDESEECIKRCSLVPISTGGSEQGEDVKDIHVTINQVQVTDESAEYLKNSSAVFNALRNLGKSEEGEAVRDICETDNQILIQGADGSEEYLQSCSVNNIFETEQDPLAEKATLRIGLNTSNGIMQREQQHGNTSEVLDLGDRQVSDSPELGKPKVQLDPLSYNTVDQVYAPSTEALENRQAGFFKGYKPDPHTSMLENDMWNESKDSPVSSDPFEGHSAPVKMENIELKESYDEVVLDMEEILLESSESPGARFTQGNRTFQSHLPLPLRDGGSTASTSGTDDVYPPLRQLQNIDGVEVIGAKQKKGDVSLGERLVGVKEYTVYKIRVWSGNDQWEVERRYRDFFTLYRRMKTVFSDQGWNLPSPWSSVERESRKIFGNASPDVVAERSVLIQECLRSILHFRFLSSPPNALIWFLSPQNAVPTSFASNTLMPSSTSFNRGVNIENVSALGKTISLVVELQPYKSMKQMLEAQHYTCAGCHKHFDDGKTLVREFVQTFGWGKPRLCEYTGQLFCSMCHTNDTAVLPARVLHHWDFTEYPISQLAKSYLDSIHDQPMLCVSAVNPFLFSKVPALLHVTGVRKKIGAILPYIRCPFRRSVNKGLGSRRYLLESNDFFALRDLIDLSKGAFSALPVMVETVSRKILEHITEQCLICCDVGVPCNGRQACNDPSSFIFPFQEGEVDRCKSCELVFHKSCFRKLTNCPCGVQLRAEEVTGLTKKASGRGGGKEGEAVDLLGRKLSSTGLGGGFLTGLFARARQEKALDHKESDNVILMGSLPSTSL